MGKGTYVTRQHNTASWLWLLGLFGFCGLHRIYMGKRITGVLWLFTLGLYGVGQVYDMFALKGMLKDSNTKFLGKVKPYLPSYTRDLDRTPVKPKVCDYCGVAKNIGNCKTCGAPG